MGLWLGFGSTDRVGFAGSNIYSSLRLLCANVLVTRFGSTDQAGFVGSNIYSSPWLANVLVTSPNFLN